MESITVNESPIMEEITEHGNTHDADGVPLGLINYMIGNRLPRQRAVRVGDRIGYLHFSTSLIGSKRNLHIWDDVA